MADESTTPDLLELGRRIFEAGRRADVDGLIGFYRSGVVIEMPEAGLTFEGPTEIRRFYEDVFGLWEDLVSELEELLDLGNGVTFSVISNRGRPVGSTAEARQRLAWVTTWEECKITRVDVYVDIDEGRAAAERLAEERGYAVTQENVEIVKRAIDAFNLRDVEACAALVTADFEWAPALAEIESEVFRGRDGIEAYFGSLSDAWGEWRLHGEEFRDVGGSLLVVIRMEARGRGSGAPVAGRQSVIFGIRDGKISRVRAYLEHGKALRAAGLRE